MVALNWTDEGPPGINIHLYSVIQKNYQTNFC